MSIEHRSKQRTGVPGDNGNSYVPASDPAHVTESLMQDTNVSPENFRGGPTRNLTDLGNAERLIDRHGEDLRYVHAWGRYLAWDGKRWALDDTGEADRRAVDTVLSTYAEAEHAIDKDKRRAIARHAAASESRTRIEAMIALARSRPGIPARPEDLDADPWLLNVQNGTIDLRTGELRKHQRSDMITKLAPVEYDPKATAPLWTATLERVLPNENVRVFFKKLCGYAITGSVSEHVLPVLYGTGANGKSTVLNTLLEAVGNYGIQAAPDLLVAKRGGHPTELADLFGMRLVTSIEVDDGRRLAEALVKSLTGGESIRARRMRQDFWEFSPTHTVFLCTNHKPEVRGTDLGIWRRIRLIPFTETIPPNEQDKKLPEKLRDELDGILAWAVEGCLEWQHKGLSAPDEVRKATAGYRADMDVIGAFLRDECETGVGLRATVRDVYERYQEWCEDGHEHRETKRKFNALLTERGAFTTRRSGKGGLLEWHGLGLLTKQNAVFAGKLTKHSINDHKQLEDSSRSTNNAFRVSSSVRQPEPENGALLPEDFVSIPPRQDRHPGSEEKSGHEGAPSPDNLPSPDGGSASGSSHGWNDVVGQARDEGVDPSVGPRERRLTTEGLAYYYQLRREGIDPEKARAKVLGDDDGMES